ncbi:MAG: ATP-binding protein [Saprospiraceae bacterium]|nr:ATP-binding protein [Saprospiraceae bacterium]
MSRIHIVFGPQGAGKSTYAKNLSEELNAIHLSIDKWMWQLYGPDLPRPLNLKWIMERVHRCEQQIWSVTKKISNSGSAVILDLGFTKLAKREMFISLAKEEGIPIQLHYIHAPRAIRRKRVLNRNKTKGENFSFEVTPGMFDFMEGEFEKPIEQEIAYATVVDTT